MVGCIEGLHRFGHPVAGVKRVYHQKSFFFSLEILLGTDMIHKLYNFEL